MLELLTRSAQTETAPAAAPPEEPRQLSRTRRLIIFLAIPTVVLAWAAMVVGLYFASRKPAVTVTPLAHGGPPDGRVLYAANCASCHGPTGRADGPNSSALMPQARKFGFDKFRFGSTTNGVPTDADLARVIRRGIPGSAMPGFDRLSDAEVAALVGHVRTLARSGTYNRLLEKAAQSGDVDPLDLLEIVDRQCTPGEPLAVPDRFAVTAESLAHGRQVFNTVCASCHGPAGKGDGPQVKDLKNEDGSPTRPRDLTSGIYKGGDDPAQIYTRIMLGMPGTPMPASSQLPPQDIEAVLGYILSLPRSEVSSK